MNRKLEDPGPGTGPGAAPGGPGSASSRSKPKARRDPPPLQPGDDPVVQLIPRDHDPEGPACPGCGDTLLKVARYYYDAYDRVRDERPLAPYWCQRENTFYTRRGKPLDDHLREQEEARGPKQ